MKKNNCNRQEGHSHSHTHNTEQNIKIVFFINLFFSILEFIGGYLTNSVAIMSDAIHDLGDTISLGSSYFLEKKSNKDKNEIYNYGYKRFSVISGLINSIILSIGSLYVIIEAVKRLFNPQDVDVDKMVIFAIIGIIANGYAVFSLNEDNINEKTARLHLLEDVLGWVSILIVSIIMKFIYISNLDTITSLIISIIILKNTFNNLKYIINILTQKNILTENMKKEIMLYVSNLINVKDYSDFRIWSLDGIENIGSIHLIIEKDLNHTEIYNIKKNIKEFLKTNYNVTHFTIEMDCNCNECNKKN